MGKKEGVKKEDEERGWKEGESKEVSLRNSRGDMGAMERYNPSLDLLKQSTYWIIK